ncbi:hypothetical protein [Streptomyces sp. JJ36]|uniref:hypothetical protein n=1 Tax=Streptomyces sp. JJ36 TaxID=2736645 RepID=UPI001F34C971|nr:hypothetical protein [Streptomyces sp. JJ36]MCF6525632.1 hypothetical protein [Streptomyces sp. JJ36]
MPDPEKYAPSASEELENELREAATDVTDEEAAAHESEAGDTLTPSRPAQRQAAGLDELRSAREDGEEEHADDGRRGGDGTDAGGR